MKTIFTWDPWVHVVFHEPIAISPKMIEMKKEDGRILFSVIWYTTRKDTIIFSDISISIKSLCFVEKLK
jgi:hypothetical protein